MLKVAADINETQRLYEASIRMEVSVYCVVTYIQVIYHGNMHVTITVHAVIKNESTAQEV